MKNQILTTLSILLFVSVFALTEKSVLFSNNIKIFNTQSEKIHQQLTNLFKDAEKGFTKNKGVIKEDHTLYIVSLDIENTNSNYIFVINNGVTYYYTSLQTLDSKNSLVQAIESYSIKNEYKITVLDKTEFLKEYVVTKNGKTIGFLELKKHKNKWQFRLFIPLNKSRLKADLEKGVKLLENNFKDVFDEKIRKKIVTKGNKFDYKSTYSFYGASLTKVITNETGNIWNASFGYYPFAALLYQFEKMNLSFKGATKIEEKKNEQGLLVRFKKPTLSFDIFLLDYKKAPTEIWLLKSMIPNKPQVINASKQKNTKIKQYLDQALWQTGSVDNSYKEIEKLMKKTNSSSSKFDQRNQLGYLINKYVGLRAGVNAAIIEVDKAIAEASISNCTKTKEVLKKLKTKLIDTKYDYLSAESSVREVMLGKRSENQKFWTKGVNYANSAYKKFKSAKILLNNIYEKTPCYNPGSSSTTRTNKTFIDVEPPITIDRTGKKNLVGVGLSVGSSRKYSKGLSIRNSVRGWAAYKAGMLEGATLLEINDEKVNDSYMNGQRRKLVGEKGTSVKVKFKLKSGTEMLYLLYRGKGGKVEKLDLPTPDYLGEMVAFGANFRKDGNKIIFTGETKFDWACLIASITIGDEILEVDNKSVSGLTLKEVNQLIYGKAGTKVRIKIKHNFYSKTYTYLFERGQNGKGEKIKEIFIRDNLQGFTGEFEGDNLINLMGRHLNSAVIQEWFKDSKYNFVPHPLFKFEPEEWCMYYSKKYGINLTFTKGVLSKMAFFNRGIQKAIKLPFKIVLNSSTTNYSASTYGFKQGSGRSENQWRKVKEPFVFVFETDKKTNLIKKFVINSEK